MVESQIRQQSLKEEWVNTLSHGVGMIGALLLLPYMVMVASRDGDSLTVAGARIFGYTLILLYGSSTIYHAVPVHSKRAKLIFNRIDHIAVYFLIAGTYTPFTLDVLRGPLGWSLFALIWLLAMLGTALKYQGRLQKQPYSVAYYLFMGWLVIFAMVPLCSQIAMASVLALIGGGVFYSVGVYFYLSHHRPYAHFVWHLFVLAGTALHVSAVLGVYAG